MNRIFKFCLEIVFRVLVYSFSIPLHCKYTLYIFCGLFLGEDHIRGLKSYSHIRE